MRRSIRMTAVAAGLTVALAAPMSASAVPSGVETFEWSDNMTPIGQSLYEVPMSGAGAGVYNSDLAFWGQRAYQGTYDGFRIIDISDPADMVEVYAGQNCSPPNAAGVRQTSGNQGDIVVWGSTHPSAQRADILVRAHNSNTPVGATCGGVLLPRGGPNTGSNAGFEGLTIWDIRDEANPKMIAVFDLPNGTHTLTLLPDMANDRIIISSNSSGGEQGIRLVGIPLSILDNPPADPGDPEPAELSYYGLTSTNPNQYGDTIPAVDPVTGYPNAGRNCHDTGVILGSAMKAACSGGNGYALWNLDPNDPDYGTHPVTGEPASLTNWVLMRSPSIAASTGHTAAFTWDGEIFIFGSEPGGGSQAQCQATSNDRNKAIRFFDVATGEELGRHVLPRPQTNTENCTIHNLNVVPLGPMPPSYAPRYVLVHGSYQSGIGVVDFSDIRNPIGSPMGENPATGGDVHANLTTTEIAYADPAPLSPTPPIILGGSWSAHWYDGVIYDSDIKRGLFSWKLDAREVRAAVKLGSLNPQTQTFTLPGAGEFVPPGLGQGGPPGQRGRG